LLSATTTLTATWQRFTHTFVVAASYTQLGFVFTETPTGTAGAADYFEMTGVQVDVGSVALPFRTNGSTYEVELAACQRYYFRNTAGDSSTHFSAAMGASSTTEVDLIMLFPVTMRIRPTSLDYSLILTYDGTATYSSGTFALITGRSGVNTATVRYTHGSAALTQYRPYQIAANSNANAYIGFSAEL